jgi:beta-glucosidase-like glycosyl hydrolase
MTPPGSISADQLVPIGGTLREKLAQLMMVRLGSNMPPPRTVEEDEERVAELLAKCAVGGLVLFNGSFAETPHTLARLQRLSKYPLLVAADFERGVGQQLAGYPVVPHALAFDAMGDDAEEAVRRFGQLTGATSRAVGVHIPFAPVADVNSDPRNPIIATRAFGTAPERVANLVAAFVEGCRAGGALPTAKHFPGHGNTEADSHHVTPTVAATRDQLDERDLPPFRAAIHAGVPLIMTAHVAYPSLDGGTVATLSHAILTRLLRDELGFQGAVVSDSFLMEGVKVGAQAEGQRAVQAIAAGVDMLVDLADPLGTLEALETAVAAGQLTERRVDEALGRIERLKELAFFSPAPVDMNDLQNQTAALAHEVASRAAVILKDEHGLLPLNPAKSLGAVLINPYPRPANAPASPLREQLAAKFSQLAYFELGASPSSGELERAARAAEQSDQFLAAIVVKPAAWHHFGLPAWAVEWLRPLVGRRPTVAACLGAPQGLEPISSAAAHICTFSDVQASQLALVENLMAPKI